jgi:hypothetical protein
LVARVRPPIESVAPSVTKITMSLVFIPLNCQGLLTAMPSVHRLDEGIP